MILFIHFSLKQWSKKKQNKVHFQFFSATVSLTIHKHHNSVQLTEPFTNRTMLRSRGSVFSCLYAIHYTHCI